MASRLTEVEKWGQMVNGGIFRGRQPHLLLQPQYEYDGVGVTLIARLSVSYYEYCTLD